MTTSRPVRRELIFHGQVQGVGFRMTTERIAGRHDVAGWIRNEPDGTVRCVVEGPIAVVDAFLAEVHETMTGYIADTREHQAEAAGEFDGFEVRFQ